jgi:3-hexulose-6-phosphate synthase
MKFQVSFDFLDLDQSLGIASEIADFVDIFEIGTVLIYKHGSAAVEQFKTRFPQKKILADSKIVDRGKEVVEIFSQAGADWMTVMAGTGKNVIHTACTSAHDMGKKIMLDLMDSSSLGQSALEAKNLGVDAILFHQAFDEKEAMTILDKWDMVKGNTDLPIFVAAKISRDSIAEIIQLQPDGVIIGRSITAAQKPGQEAEYFSQMIKNIG